MLYQAVRWHHNSPTDPVEIVSELDSDLNEVRKVERFADGRLQFADANRAVGDTFLGLEPWPPIAEIAADPEFAPRVIDASEFEALWREAVGQQS